MKKTHGLTRTNPIYRVWASMKGRCLNKNNSGYKKYGALGITVCKEWLLFDGFWAWAKKDYVPGLELHRIKNDGPYSPDNCTWLTTEEHSKQPKKSDRILTHNGKTQRVADWCRELGVKPSTINMRIDKYGWSIEKALSQGGKLGSATNPAKIKTIAPQ